MLVLVRQDRGNGETSETNYADAAKDVSRIAGHFEVSEDEIRQRLKAGEEIKTLFCYYQLKNKCTACGRFNCNERCLDESLLRPEQRPL